MDTRPKIEPPTYNPVLSVTVNDDGNFFVAGLETGFKVFYAGSAALKTDRELMGGIGLAQMLGSTNIIALVGGGRNPKFAANKVVAWDEMKQKGQIEITTLTPVRGCRLSRDMIIVVLQNNVRVYKFAKPESRLISSYETANNLAGICCLSGRHIAFPGRTPGQVQIVEIITGNVSIIPAHSNPLRALAFSRDGELLATASDHGTIVRVYAIPSCAKICEVRRGWDPAAIYSLGFDPSGRLLACTSDKGTLHVFDVPHPKYKNELPTSPIMGTFPDSPPGSSSDGTSNGNGRGKWGFLSKVPFLPPIFSDTYSFASCPFSIGDEPSGGLPLTSNDATLGTTKPQKGVIGWCDQEHVIVVGAGLDARWEKFKIEFDRDTGNRSVRRVGWKRYCSGD